MTTTIHGTPLPRGQVQTPPDTSMADCYPSDVLLPCNSCARRRRGDALPPEDRLRIVIDASTLPVPEGGRCMLWTAVQRCAA